MLITLTTDFGLADTYVAQMKGIILGIAPKATIIDATHGVPPQDIVAGALAIESIVDAFPPGTIHVGVVDPGVGGDRAAVAVRTKRAVYIGPDNGLFTAALAIDPPVAIITLDKERYHRQPVSATFHGRDIFAPAAAHLAAGVSFDKLGSRRDGIVRFDLPEPVATDDGGLRLTVLRVDGFGNLVTNLTADSYAAWLSEQHLRDGAGRLHVGRVVIAGVGRTFAAVDTQQPVAYFGSAGRLEVALRDGDAAASLRVERGMEVALTR